MSSAEQPRDGENVALADLLDAAVEYISVKEGLLAHHRAGSPPSEAFWKRRDKAQLRWEWARTQANIALGRLSGPAANGSTPSRGAET